MTPVQRMWRQRVALKHAIRDLLPRITPVELDRMSNEQLQSLYYGIMEDMNDERTCSYTAEA